ncbi:MAG: hypothetical protein ACJ74Y_03850 [Bryobacteraceae bacterium]
MRTIVFALVVIAGLTVGLGCQPADQKAARERAESIQKKAESAAKQLGEDARQFGSKLNEKAQEAGANRDSASEPSAEEKLKH